MPPEFSGFPKEAMTFLRGLKKNNNREWFQAHKPVYEEKVKAPILELIGDLNAALAGFAPDYVTDPAKAVYRIYRDTRFSPDKTPYKTHVSALFTPRGLEKHASGSFYFQVSAQEIGVAGGIYMPGPDQLLAMRTHLADHHERLKRILKSKQLRALVGDLAGDQLTRVPKGFPCDHPAADLIRMKQWYVYVELEAGIATTPKLFDELVKRFRVMTPLVEFLNEPLTPRKPAMNFTTKTQRH
jgi:uncharacterized protein (TIGR02453 family)